VRASIARAAGGALDELAEALPAPIGSISLRALPANFFDAKTVVTQATAVLGSRAGDVLDGARARLGPPWTKDHRIALAAIVTAE
jgi:hypothetical protein